MHAFPIRPLGLCLTATAMLLGGCSSIPVERETADLSLEYEVEADAPDTDKVVSIVSPRIAEQAQQQETAEDQMDQLKKMAASNGGGSADSALFEAGKTFDKSYRDQLREALSTTFEEIVSSRGLRTAGPYDSFDTITYTEKQDHYLALVPELDFTIEQVRTNRECSPTYCTDEGEIQINGQLHLKAVEPMTEQTFVNKRIDFTRFDVSKSYISQAARPGGGGNSLVATAIDSATAPDSLQDTSDKALVEAINEFYAKAAEEIDRTFSREEMLSFEKDVEELKDRKRY